jgi:hypothetical protein
VQPAGPAVGVLTWEQQEGGCSQTLAAAAAAAAGRCQNLAGQKEGGSGLQAVLEVGVPAVLALADQQGWDPSLVAVVVGACTAAAVVAAAGPAAAVEEGPAAAGVVHTQVRPGEAGCTLGWKAGLQSLGGCRPCSS